MDLTDKVMLVKFSGSVFGTEITDKKITQEVAVQKGVPTKKGRYVKTILAQLKSLSKLKSKAYTFHIANTLPWEDRGLRLITVANYETHKSTMECFKDEFEAAVNSAVENLDDMIAQDQAESGDMFNSADYPTADELRDRCSLTVEYNPFFDSSTFDRLGFLDSATKAQLVESADKKASEGYKMAMGDLWQRLYEAVTHMAARLGDPEAIFKKSLVGNIQELCDLLPRLNINGDSKLTNMAREASEKLLKYDAETLREDPVARKEMADVALDFGKTVREIGMFPL
jgi:hypothetical protein